MPDWCAHCGAMLPQGLETCPRCGKPIKAAGDESKLDTRSMAATAIYVIGLALIPIAAIVLIGIICVNLGN